MVRSHQRFIVLSVLQYLMGQDLQPNGAISYGMRFRVKLQPVGPEPLIVTQDLTLDMMTIPPYFVGDEWDMDLGDGSWAPTPDSLKLHVVKRATP